MRSALVACLAGWLTWTTLNPAGVSAQRTDSTAVPPSAGTPVTPPAGTMPPMPQARKIPGINAPDEFPKACVSCHVNLPERQMDMRLSMLLKAWNLKVDAGLLAKAQVAAPSGVTLAGKHPVVKTALRNIPKGCVTCHGTASKKAPPFARLMHLIHLTGGDESHFMTMFQGECTNCHKLNTATGTWTIPSGPEP